MKKVGNIEIRDQQNLFGVPVLKLNNPDTVTLPMNLKAVSLPNAVGKGRKMPIHTDTDFCVFELWKQGFKGLSVVVAEPVKEEPKPEPVIVPVKPVPIEPIKAPTEPIKVDIKPAPEKKRSRKQRT